MDPKLVVFEKRQLVTTVVVKVFVVVTRRISASWS